MNSTRGLWLVCTVALVLVAVGGLIVVAPRIGIWKEWLRSEGGQIVDEPQVCVSLEKIKQEVENRYFVDLYPPKNLDQCVSWLRDEEDKYEELAAGYIPLLTKCSGCGLVPACGQYGITEVFENSGIPDPEFLATNVWGGVVNGTEVAVYAGGEHESLRGRIWKINGNWATTTTKSPGEGFLMPETCGYGSVRIIGAEYTSTSNATANVDLLLRCSSGDAYIFNVGNGTLTKAIRTWKP